MSTELAIRASQLTRRFGELIAVNHVDLRVERARIFGFLGPNGSGKSTTIRMLCGLLRPSEGEAEVLGHRVPRDAEALRSKIGYMTQQFSLYKDLSASENLEFLAAIYSIPRSERRTRIERVFSQFDLEALTDQRAGTLSGGQRQRLALAAAMLHEPELLFLDEPTAGVDPQSRRDFWEVLFDLADAGTTVLVTTHFMDEAERCHDLAILDQGRLVVADTPRNLKRDIGVSVIRIETDEQRAAHHCLQELPFVLSVTQLGTRLHALVDPQLTDPADRLQLALDGDGLTAETRTTEASLEDVFVAATSRPFPGDGDGP